MHETLNYKFEKKKMLTYLKLSSEKKKGNLIHLQKMEWSYEKLNDKSCTNEFHEKNVEMKKMFCEESNSLSFVKKVIDYVL